MLNEGIMSKPLFQILPYIVVIFISVISVKPQAASIADSLDKYVIALSIPKINGIPDSNISGVTGNPLSGTLYLVDNNSCSIYEVTKSGSLLRRIPTSGFDDLEGIANYSGSYFFVAEEQRGNIVRINIPAIGTDKIYKKNGIVTNIGTGWDNSGVEGVSCRSSDSIVFAVKEKDPAKLFTIYLDNTGFSDSVVESFSFYNESKNGDAADIFALPGGDFLLVNEEKSLLEGYSSTGKILSKLDLSFMEQPEGVTVDSSGSIYVVGEPCEFFVFRKDSTLAKRMYRKSMTGSFSLNTWKIDMNSIGIELTMPYESEASFDLFSISGKKIMTIGKHVHPGRNIIRIETTKKLSGTYICKVKATSFAKNNMIVF